MASQDFNQIIGEKYSQLTKGEKQIANYLRKNQDEVGLPLRGRVGGTIGAQRSNRGAFCPQAGF